MVEKNKFFNENAIVVFTQDGEVVVLPRISGERNHTQAFIRLERLIPDLLAGYQNDFQTSGGFELASFVGASGSAIIWPSDVNRSDILIVTLPKILLSVQCERLREYLPLLKGYDVYASVARFKNNRSPKIIKESLSDSGKCDDAIAKVESYIDKSQMLNEMSEETNIDIRVKIGK